MGSRRFTVKSLSLLLLNKTGKITYGVEDQFYFVELLVVNDIGEAHTTKEGHMEFADSAP